MPTLNWIGKEAVVEHHKEVPFHLLRCNPDLSVGNSGSGNLLIQGDNLLALKALLPYYAGMVKCIYIDPPYNTGNESWVYNDSVNSPEIQAWLGEVVGKEAEDLSRHDKWLCMMYPRLVLLRELLHEQGSFWMSIDDNEVHHARAILNEVFGERNFIAGFVWQKRVSPDSDEKFATSTHDYILSYAKHKTLCSFNRLPRTIEANSRYRNPDNDPRGPWTSSDLTRREYREHDYYAITLPSGRQVYPAAGRSWSVPKETFKALVKDDRIWFGNEGNSMPRRKRFLSEVSSGIVPTTWWVKEDFGDNQAAKRELRRMSPEVRDIFATPKPTRLIRGILQIAADPNALVLDSFAGSGTTGHAVMQLNQEDGGERRFILVEMETDIAQYITTERLKRAIEGYTWTGQRDKVNEVEGLGGSFRYCELGAPIFDSQGQIQPEVTFSDLAQHVFFTEMGEPLNLTGLGDLSGLDGPLLGVVNDTAVYLLYNGILGDKSPNGGNVLTRRILATLPPHDGPKVVYGEGCLLGAAFLHEQGITFRQIPYEVKVS